MNMNMNLQYCGNGIHHTSYRAKNKAVPAVLVILTVLAFSVIATSLWAVAQPVVTLLLPGPKDKIVNAWKAVSGGLQYGKGETLTNIYDGGYQEYIDAGVVDAAQNLYQRGSDTMQVTVHTMESAKAAQSFLASELKASGAKLLPKTKVAAMVSSKEQSVGYAYSGKYFVTVTSMYGGPKAPRDVVAFLKVVIKKAAAAEKATK